MGNHVTGVISIDAFGATQNVLRMLYGNPVIESLLLIAVAAQIGLGMAMTINDLPRYLCIWDAPCTHPVCGVDTPDMRCRSSGLSHAPV